MALSSRPTYAITALQATKLAKAGLALLPASLSNLKRFSLFSRIMPMLKKQSFIEDYLVDSSTNNDLSINTMEPMSSSHVVNATAALTPFDGPAIAVFTRKFEKFIETVCFIQLTAIRKEWQLLIFSIIAPVLR
jgi:hypothetical protein